MRPRAASRWHHPALQPGWIDRPHQTLELGDLPLESGEVIRDFGISYVTHGARAPADDNVILVLTAIGSTHHRLDFLIGPDRPLDPDRHFIICADAIGNGLTTSPSNSPAQPDLAFPRFTIREWLRVSAGCSTRSASGSLLRLSGPRWAACRRYNGASAIPLVCAALSPWCRWREPVPGRSR